jgi:hypothetical protein
LLTTSDKVDHQPQFDVSRDDNAIGIRRNTRRPEANFAGERSGVEGERLTGHAQRARGDVANVARPQRMFDHGSIANLRLRRADGVDRWIASRCATG